MIKAVMYDDNTNNNIHLVLLEDSVHSTVGVTTCSIVITKVRSQLFIPKF